MLGLTEENHENPHGSRSLSRDLNPKPPEYEAGLNHSARSFGNIDYDDDDDNNNNNNNNNECHGRVVSTSALYLEGLGLKSRTGSQLSRQFS
jgi:hypothetical protein